MPIDPGLLAAYNATDYVIQADQPVIARPEEWSAEADALLAARAVHTAAVITAWNPYSQTLFEAENAQAQQLLIEAVETLGLHWLPAEGRSRDGAWPPEPSLCVLGVPLPEAEDLARGFRQNALLGLEIGHPTRVVVTA